MKLSLNTNIGSLTAQNQLLEAKEKLQTSFERLSSGLRINRASDDPAGLAMSSGLQTDSRLMAQAVRNVNDGISLLTVAEGALKELNKILDRQAELAQQAANGTFTSRQRQAAHKEANALVEEFNRIITSTELNDIAPIDLSTKELVLQVGLGQSNSLTLDLADSFGRTTGSGTFQDPTSFDAYLNPTDIMIADINGDGANDHVVAYYGVAKLGITLGNGNGTFAATTTIDAAPSVLGLAWADFNGDGNLDIATGSGTGGDNAVSIHLGNGDGTFQARETLAAMGRPQRPVVGDFNGDGWMDVAAFDTDIDPTDALNVFIGNGDGTFAAVVSYETGVNSKYAAVGDFNGDDILDIVAPNDVDDSLFVIIGRGDGTFEEEVKIAAGDAPWTVAVSDLNNDGILDLAVTNSGEGTVSTFIGDGAGNFDYGVELGTSSSTPEEVRAEDINGDGHADLVISGNAGSTVDVFIGRGNGTFQDKITLSAGVQSRAMAVGDLNNDDAPDILTAGWSDTKLQMFIANTRDLSLMPALALGTAENAVSSLNVISETKSRVSAGLSNIGAAQSRLSHTVNHLQVMRENYAAANSKIVDADIAEEVAQMVRQQILQQAITAVMAQANQQPALVLQLLK